MGRSSTYSGTRIGREMEDAINKINHMQQCAVAALTEYPVRIDQTIAMLFNDEDVAKSAAVRNIITPSGWVRGYTILPDTTLAIDYDDDRDRAHCLPINPTRFQPNPFRIAPLNDFIGKVGAIYLQYEEVKGVLRWLNTNATLGAIRYYFPAAMQLCPATFAGMGVPSRHDTPDGVSVWLQPIRDAAATVASATMLPKDVEPRKRHALWLTFSSRKVSLGDTGAHYTTDQITLNA